ncbi:MAG: hypothetical protein IT379_37345 [Deltaproteobacteria bacterium]|nr:hypothetical protein [Deltaproteobacteria bacterium]
MMLGDHMREQMLDVCGDEMEVEMSAAKETVALAVVPASDDERTTTLAPFSVERQLPALLQLGKVLIGARGMVPAHLKTEGEIVAALLAGAELGIPPMASLRNIHIIQGRVALDASLQLGLLHRYGVRTKWLESTGERAVLWLQRPGFDPHTQPYTIDDAKTAGLLGKDNWRNHPKAMLRARCVSAAVKAYAADIVTGVYTPDELEEIGERAPMRVESRVVLDEPPAPDVEHVTAVMEEQARERVAADKLAEEYGPMIDACEDDTALVRFCAFNGYQLRSMHKNAKARLWTRLQRRAAALMNPEGLQTLEAAKPVGELLRELKDEIASASGPDDVDDPVRGRFVP